MTNDEFDNKVIQVAKSFGNNKNIRYNIWPTNEIEGNCNTSTSTILIKSGVEPQEMKRIRSLIPGFPYGFSIRYAKPWTYEEQDEAVKVNEKSIVTNTYTSSLKKNIMSNNSTNKVDPVIKCFFVSLCTCMALPVLFSFSLTVIVLSFLSAALMIIPLNTLFIYVISRIRLFRWSLHSVWYVISESYLLILYMYFYDRIAIMYFPKFRFYALCEISVFIAIQLVFVLVASICRNRMIKNKQKQKDV